MSVFTVSTGTKKPTLKLLNRHIKNDIAAKWRDLGIELLDEEQHSKLDNIERNNHEVEDCCTELFKFWLEVDTYASWNELIKALNNIDKKSLAEKIKREILNGIVVILYLNIVTQE